MTQAVAVSAIAQQIQMAVAPVFLLAGIGAFLNVMTQRLARTVERERSLERDFGALDDSGRERVTAELHILDRRVTVVNLAITACTASALFVCILVAMLFVSDLTDVTFSRQISWLFIISMLLLIVGLVLFLWEIRLAVSALGVWRAHMPHRRG